MIEFHSYGLSEVLPLLFLVLMLALILVAPRRGGRPVSYAAKVGAVVVLVWGGISILIVLAWPLLLALLIAQSTP